MGVTQWAYTMITRAPEVIKNCGNNRNVRNVDAGRRKTMSTSPATRYLKM
tara:strand:+ start:228 stop:377 length:150 start_codon:yes stop_codon:yes gene_type:complete